ncbi:MAG: zinc-ribbon domain-containing protein [Polyangiaceae bacterium]
MKITCHSCGAKYAIADDKVRGRRVKVRCKGCRTAIVVDGYTMDADQSAAEADGGMGDDDATRVHPGVSGMPGMSAAEGDAWSVNLTDTDQRTMTTAEIVDSWNSGQMPEDAYVWKEGMDDWLPIGDVPELVAAISGGRQAAAGYGSQPPQAPPSQPPYVASPAAPAYAPPEPAPYVPPSQPAPAASPFGGGEFNFSGGAAAEPARVSSPRAQAGVDLFGNVAAAGSEAESHSLPAAGAYEEKPTGARNENSVLFSLDALKAGMTPSAKTAPVLAKPEEKANLDDIMGVGGGSNALFGLAQNQSLLTAPAPPPPPPPKAVIPSDPPPVGASASIAPGMAPAKNNKLIFALGGAVALLLIVVVVLGVAFMGGKKDGEVAKAESGESSKKSGSEKSTEKSGSEKSGEEKSGASGTEEPAAGTAASGEEKKEVSEEDKKRFAEAMKKKEEEAKAAGDEKKEEVAKKEEPSSGVASFNKGAAIASLSAAASAATRCKKPGGPTGSGKAIVTFAPSGRVTSANVAGGAFGGTAVGGCVAGVFRSARVPAFSGDPVTVSKGFTIPP